MNTIDSKLDKIVSRYQFLNDSLLNDSILPRNELKKISKEISDLSKIFEKAREYKKLKQEISEAEEILSQPEDEEFIAMVKNELEVLEKRLKDLLSEIKIMLLPKDEDDDKNVILEVRAGTGGEEAALFAATLFQMYSRYANRCHWTFEIASISETGLNGYKEASAFVRGKNVFANMKFESGVHRVQRVPETESSGRIHTSAVTVAVLPEVEDIDIKLEEKDLKIDVYRASGAGGQHVNTTDSAVRVTHIPTGVIVVQQDDRSQHKNKDKALKILRSRLYELQKREKEQERSEMRKNQVGSGDRSERIRTYNYHQGRVTDHRINLTLYELDKILGEGALEKIIKELAADSKIKSLANEWH